MKREIIKTSDGSTTIYLKELDETYHSRHGAVQEANHVFINQGIKRISKDQIEVLEIGLGTGLNAFLTAIYAESTKKKIDYFGLEAYPVSIEMANECDYTSNNEEKEIFDKIHSVAWEKDESISSFFNLFKSEVKLEDFATNRQFDIVYFDAFGKRAQPEMWDIKMLQNCTKHLKSEGTFVTYSANGQLKRDLKSLGLEVESVPGPPGKREMVVATLK